MSHPHTHNMPTHIHIVLLNIEPGNITWNHRLLFALHNQGSTKGLMSGRQKKLMLYFTN